ncbi:MAG: LuxR family transcriptional regulator [Limisphaerales bacterium]|nr:MAG: LuxR family transcriptional regulator [Limisphaerales bacterium]KAG0507514.1 MAG: LuxR family transcriptional regulator [Limisphaerales bacterium]TXT48986.1 MAG: LuxR family transcriptional regulator [Limisphaerales bacterium]
MSIKVSIVEDDRGIRENLSVLVGGSPGFSCASTHGNAEEALRQIPLKSPDVVLMDINLPKLSGIECVRQLKAQMPRVQFLMLTVYEDSDMIFKALGAGASGYLLKRTPPARLLDAIEEVHAGASPMSGKVARIVVQFVQRMKQAAPPTELLSKREQEILDLLAKGYRYKEIADLLTISYDTVRSHIRNIYDKLQVHSRTEAVVRYLRP